MWLLVVNDFVSAMNNDKILCGSFGLYASYVAVIVNSGNPLLRPV